MVKKEIKIECRGAGELALSLITPLQGKLKTLSNEDYEKLRNEIIVDGFSEPISVWENPEDAKIYILNGHQRHATLVKMKEEGYVVPQIPVNFVEAKDLNQAKHKLLAMASQYGKVNQQGLLDFLQDSDIKYDDIATNFNFPEIDLPKFIEENLVQFERVEVIEPEIVKDEPKMRVASSDVRQIQLFYNSESAEKMNEMIDLISKRLELDNISDVIYQLVEDAYNKLKF